MKRQEQRDVSENGDPDEGEVSLGRLSEFLGFRLRRVQNQLARDFSIKTERWELRAGMFSALEIISANPGISQALLSLVIGLDKSSVVPLVDELERRAWVLRTRSANDRRRNQLTITAKGKTELDAMMDALKKTEEAGLRSLTSDQRALVSAALDNVYRAYVQPKRD